MDTVLRFLANQVTFDACDDENIAYVYLSAVGIPEDCYLMISRCLDSRLKSDVFLEYDDQSRVSRGGVLRYQVQDDRLTLEIEQSVAEALGVPDVRQIVVDFELAPDSMPELRHALATIFAESGVYEGR